MPNYRVKQGDCISSIADEMGFFWETLWNHSQNAQLKRERKNPNALLPGDQVFIPEKRSKDEKCATDKAHYFRIKGVPVRFNIRIVDAAGNPRAGIPYTLTVDGKSSQGKTSNEGKISEVIAPNAKEGKLTLEPPGRPPEEHELQLGHMNPIEHLSGAQARLQNLGYYDGETGGEMNDDTADALRRFQKDAGLSETGELDDATRSALADRHGG